MDRDNSVILKKKLIIGISVSFCVCLLCIFALRFLWLDGKNDLDKEIDVSSDNVLHDDSEIQESVDVSFDFSVEIDTSAVSSESASEEESSTVNVGEGIETLVIPEGVVLGSPNVLVYNLTEQRTIYSKIEYEICAPASLTKMLTALVALDYISIESTVKVGDEIDMIGENSSVAFLQKGSRYKMSTMLEALMLPSGNDAAYCLAVNAARAHANDYSLPVEEAVKDFVRLMNEKAKGLGCISSSFLSPDGYDVDGQYTTTEDMLLISIAAHSNSYIKDCVSKSVNTQHGWYNSNMLIREDSDYYNPCVTGMKTGSTDAAGKCVAVSAEIGDKTYIMLFMKGESSDGRYIDANTIIDLIKEQANIDEPAEAESSELSVQIQ